MGDQVPFVSQPGPSGNGGNKEESKTTGGGDEESKEKAHFQEVKAKALEDKSIQALQDKADNATSDDEHRKASKDYYKALYGKMRKIDPSLKEHINGVENARMKRFEQPGAK